MKIADMPLLHPSDDAITLSIHIRLAGLGIASSILAAAVCVVIALAYVASASALTFDPESDQAMRVSFWGAATFVVFALFTVWSMIGLSAYVRTYKQFDAVAIAAMKKRASENG